MSSEAVMYVLALDIPRGPKHVATVLASHVDKNNGMAFPGQKLLASECGLSDRHVRRMISELVDLGVFQKGERRRKDGYRTSDEYELVGFVKWFQSGRQSAQEFHRTAMSGENGQSGDSHRTSATVSPDICDTSHRTLMSAQEPLVEPLVEPSASCPPPPKRTADEKLWDEFNENYPWRPNMSKKKAMAKFYGLTKPVMRKAIAGLVSLNAEVKAKPDMFLCHAATYIDEARWETHLAGQSGKGKQITQILIPAGSAQWQAWAEYYQAAGKAFQLKGVRQIEAGEWVGSCRGRLYFPSDWPPGHEPGQDGQEAQSAAQQGGAAA